MNHQRTRPFDKSTDCSGGPLHKPDGCGPTPTLHTSDDQTFDANSNSLVKSGVTVSSGMYIKILSTGAVLTPSVSAGRLP